MDATYEQLARETGQPPQRGGQPPQRGGQPRRKRGAQRGNQNALKHGFYSKTFNRVEHRDIAEIEQISLDSEIDMLRVSIRRIFDLTASVTNPLEAVRYVHVLTRAVTSLDHLVIRQSKLHNAQTDLDDSMHEALDLLNDTGGVRAADMRKRYAIQKAILEARLAKYVPPPPGAPPPPDPRTLPQPDPEYDELDPFSRHYKEYYIPEKWIEAYGENTPLARYWQPRPIPGGYDREREDRLGNYSYELLDLPQTPGLPAPGEDEPEECADEEIDDNEELDDDELDDDDQDFEDEE